MKFKDKIAVALVSIGTGLTIMLDQWLHWGHFVDLDQILHHEFFALGALAFGFGILFAIYSVRKRKLRSK